MKTAYINEEGKRYGKWRVIKRDLNKSKSGEAKWICECDCGKTLSVYGSSLRKGVSNSCGCGFKVDKTGHRNRKSLIIGTDPNDKRKWLCNCDCGNRFSTFKNFEIPRSCGCSRHRIEIVVGSRYSHLVVVEKAIFRKNSIGALWVCKCDCGKMVEVAGFNLENGDRVRCGRDCPKFGWQTGDAAFNLVYGGIRRTAKRRNHEWGLTKEQVKEITSQNCHYCGVIPKQKYSKSPNGEYPYNGIDRVDSQRGYTLDNVVPCCGGCNMAKSNLDVVDFRDWVVQVYNHWASKS